MNYALETLQKELKLVEKALKGWKDDTYPEAKKLREKRLNDLQEAINIIQASEDMKARIREKMNQ